jgi:ATP-dependent exoDNAse (exonuclease V) alpha subunit
MVETQQMKNLLAEASKAGAKVVLVGDERQLQAIGAGGAFKSLSDSLGRAELTDIKRQTQDWARDLVRLFADGKADEALKKVKELEFLSTAKDKVEACEKLISAWKHKGVARPEEHLILAGTRADTEQLNTLAQSERRKAGELSRLQIGQHR